MTKGIVTVTGYHNRRSIRLRNYDYSQPGAYFVTLCIHDRTQQLFGEIVDGEIRLNECGKIIRDEWVRSFQIRHELKIDEYVIMPNHFHGIIVIHDVPVGAYRHTPLQIQEPEFRSPSKNIGSIVRGFKSAVTKRINELRNTPGKPVWQRNYYEHIVRNEKSLFAIRRYITDNPLNWASDEENSFGEPPRCVALPNPQWYN
jgi:REP element-mobilizing transposase RayT